jgi:hypothetical protein
MFQLQHRSTIQVYTVCGLQESGPLPDKASTSIRLWSRLCGSRSSAGLLRRAH